jgi:integrase
LPKNSALCRKFACDRALWATALYGGLRRGELQALRWQDVDLASGVIRVERAWDVREGEIEPKSRAGRRTVPIAEAFDGSTVDARAKAAWRGAGLDPITLHEARHTFPTKQPASSASAATTSTSTSSASFESSAVVAES